ncbi:uncharacterized protein K452DRAFT_50701 [Aplosporella prunicola CBS 121167]|uniref:Uncharacterized protein n=1 Tax=Aplosporella prunicola CBS 121167 TaxID=1176127 RepID=A0A6A6B963_9PEZI|nr:uncharacterized protein K452DRAFT_50701 [Aplosporella prunicola CBS 121167]KAF2140739.1 hypothetical protein K452DRAFT_50701 [Aplosporella prunicola CBS 121167]
MGDDARPPGRAAQSLALPSHPCEGRRRGRHGDLLASNLPRSRHFCSLARLGIPDDSYLAVRWRRRSAASLALGTVPIYLPYHTTLVPHAPLRFDTALPSPTYLRANANANAIATALGIMGAVPYVQYLGQGVGM